MTKRAFTLVEILVALTVLLIGIVTMFNLFPLGWQSFSYAKRLHLVSLLADKKLSELKLNPSPAETSGQENNLNWKISSSDIALQDNLVMKQVQLDIDFNFQGRKMNQRFITWVNDEP